MFCFVLINSVLLNLLCVRILFFIVSVTHPDLLLLATENRSTPV